MEKYNLSKDSVILPGHMVPGFRSSAAVQRGVEKKIMFKTWGGLGDQICAEPTMRWAMRTVKDCDFYLASEHPELFAHLPFKEVFNLKKHQPFWDKYFVFDTIFPPSHLQWQFMSHMICNAVDYVSMVTFHCQIPIADREITLLPTPDDFFRIKYLNLPEKAVAIHAGKHWESKTFPKDWWDSVLSGLLQKGLKPVLIGADTDDNRTTVDVNPEGCLDLRNKLSIMECVALLKHVPVLLTNDSSPLHMAAAGKAWIGFIATCKHPDYISHWRNGSWSWRMENLGRGGAWERLDYCPNKTKSVDIDKMEESELRSYLPPPETLVNWAVDKCEIVS